MRNSLSPRGVHSRQGLLCLILLVSSVHAVPASPQPIDRQALVTRHNVVLTQPDPWSTLQVGNGEFAFAVDITGLQTFPADYRKGIQLGTQAQWAWATDPNPEGYRAEDVFSPYDAHGRVVVYADGLGKLKHSANPDRAKKANAWLRENPHRLQLGRLGLVLRDHRGTPVTLAGLEKTRQVLDLWAGAIQSQFSCPAPPSLWQITQSGTKPATFLIWVRL
jgi:protein-glucosylgalactosylhydroxylysine glucosidase